MTNKITIFGLAGTGKSSTTQKLATLLGYDFLSTGNMFREMAIEAGYSDLHKFEEEVCQKDPEHDRKLDARTKEYGETHDKFIFESRLAWYFIPDSFKIMLVCGDQERFKRMAERENKPIEQVVMETTHREESIYKRFKEYYNIDNINDTNHYDLVIDTEKNNLEQVVAIILDALQKRGIVPTTNQ